jgi:DNA-binding transcriptional ArsR family regulator
MDAFHALSAPIRRDIITILAESGKLSASDIADRFKVTPSAISQHLKVLRENDLVRMHRQAQQRIYELDPKVMLELESWAKHIVHSIKFVEVTSNS